MPKSKFGEIYLDLKGKIERGDYPYQSLLPSENTLIVEYDCSRNTIRRALASLRTDGDVQSIHGKGVRVLYRPTGKAAFTVGSIESFRETSERNQLRTETRVITFEPVVVDARLAEASGFSVGDAVWHIERVRVIGGKALILDCNWFLQNAVPGLTAEIAASSIYRYLENELGLTITTSKRMITVEHATAADRRLLDLDGFNCLAVVSSQTYDSNGTMFEYTVSRHQPDYFSFQDTALRR